ncbi:hypothetical protein [Kitasatospora purpeofusca]|uniref:hypothetical protein n=1 Tax=Kitasatospora purpeofusca TaxID=67352 RepID=UPI002254DE60|nr:hypothetical protein [Kitasatospora purpeofusca]MCX4758647.1 hypothetical protein [Kitasatospora purpeofusca]WSR30918.1 hypothetical protein OG715_07990 [Kitasatospora purpeofusca]
MPGRHRRPPTGEQAALPADIDLRLLAITQGRTVTEEGVATLPGAAHPYAYRTLYRPDGSAERLLERLAPGPLHPPGLRPTD